MKHHHPMIWKAAQQLRNAKHTSGRPLYDFNGHKADAIGLSTPHWSAQGLRKQVSLIFQKPPENRRLFCFWGALAG